MPSSPLPVTLEDVQAAAQRIAPYVHRTPVLSSTTLDRALGASARFKAENLQKVGAFKARGAVNAVLSLGPDEAGRGVATHSGSSDFDGHGGPVTLAG